jgi:hypothetical protein
VLHELLQRWPNLDSAARRRIAQTLLADPATQSDEDLRMQLERLAAGDPL